MFWGKYLGTTRRDMIFDRMMNIRPASEYNEQVCANDNSPIEVKYWPQKLDNFDSNNNNTWQQHYQVQRKYFNASLDQQVIFIQIGGEGPINNKWVCYDNYTYMRSAKNYSALVVQVEHRFFGANIGTDDLSTANLKYLTTEQALADLNNFITGFVKNFTNPKVIAFGGSYPGTMAALMRVLYPNATQGNIASSAPLLPKVDFYEYAQVMESTIRDTSMACYSTVKAAFREMVSKTLTESGRKELNDKFHLVPGLSEPPLLEDIQTVTSSMFSAFQGIIQYTFDGAADRFENKTGKRQNIAYGCQLMTDTTMGTLLDRLYKVFVLANGDPKDNPFISDYKRSIAPFLNTSIHGDQADMRGWLWLSCNQWGWLQSTANSDLFGDVVPISLYIKQCADIFDNTLNATTIANNIKNTLQRYGYPEDYNGTNVYLPNGGYDPWSSLGVYVKDNSNSDHRVSHLTPKAAHCSDMYGMYDGEPVGLNETRAIFFNEIYYHLSLESTFKKNGASGVIFAFSTLSLSFLFVFSLS
ncbi:Peptidase S28 family-containing protein [Aphelenchoides besseyi]|nr:Peptidase S28 family-containing protein [Aphelenchoides besseyi]